MPWCARHSRVVAPQTHAAPLITASVCPPERDVKDAGRTVVKLPDGSKITVEPSAYKTSGEEDASTERQRKLLRLYTVTSTREMHELEIEQMAHPEVL